MVDPASGDPRRPETLIVTLQTPTISHARTGYLHKNMRFPLSVLSLFAAAVALISCSSDDSSGPGQPASGTEVYETPGSYIWTPDARDITAKITIIGAGGGGGGGADGLAFTQSYANAGGGGGGGGAGQVTVLDSLSLPKGTNYTVVVGPGGAGGARGRSAFPGEKGGASQFAAGTFVMGTAAGGFGGEGGSVSSTAQGVGGLGGGGFPAGVGGGNGVAGVPGEATGGAGGSGANNGTQYGTGGTGGAGGWVAAYTAQNGGAGLAGRSGIVKIEWSGYR